MSEFRYKGVSLAGRPVQGVFNAQNQKDAKERIRAVAAARQFRVTIVEKRSTYLYKVRKGTERPVCGEQKAFSREDVNAAFIRMGFRVLKIRRKLLDFRMKPPFSDVVLFIRLSADLLREKLPYDEVLQIMMNDVRSAGLKNSLKEIQQELREGKDGEDVFRKQESVLGRFTAHMLGVASKSGNMVSVYETTAKFLEREQQFKKDFRSALVMPAITMLAITLAVAFYVGYIFPKTAELFIKHDFELPPMTAATLEMSAFLQENILIILAATVILFAAVVQFVRSRRGRLIFDKLLIRVPVIGTLFHKISIEIFSRVFYALYSGSGENMEPIKIGAEACRNRYMEERIKDVAIPMMLREGRGLVESLVATGVFTDTAISRYRSGAETGTIRKTALQLAEYYEKDTSYRMKVVVEFVNVNIALLIMIIMIALTIVSSETATIKPNY